MQIMQPQTAKESAIEREADNVGGRTLKNQATVEETIGLWVQMKMEQPPETVTASRPAARAGLSQPKPFEF